MNAALIAQLNYENRQPPPVSESPRDMARAEWLYNAAEQLVKFRASVTFQRRMCAAQGVTMKQFALAVDEHANKRLADCNVGSPSLGILLIEAKCGIADKMSADELLGHSYHPLGKLGEIAEALLEPLVDDALIAKAEDDEL